MKIVYLQIEGTSSSKDDMVVMLNSSFIKRLNNLLTNMRCPMLEFTFFFPDDVAKILPDDRLLLHLKLKIDQQAYK